MHKKIFLFLVLIFSIILVNFIIWKKFIIRVGEINNIDQLNKIEHLRPTPIPTPDKNDLLESLYQKVRFKESTNGLYGLAKTCKEKGMVNEIGWKPGSGYCFKTVEQQETAFKNWMDKYINKKGWSVSRALSYYSGGDYSK